MNIKNFKNEMLARANLFKSEKERLEKIFENGKKNGEDIEKYCNNILVITKETSEYIKNWISYDKQDDLFYRITMIEENVNNMKNIIRGVNDENDN